MPNGTPDCAIRVPYIVIGFQTNLKNKPKTKLVNVSTALKIFAQYYR